MPTATRQAQPPGLYAETAGPDVATPPLDGDRRASVAIIGGGFTGLSTALHLAQRGCDVVVLEAQGVGWGASGRNGGQVNPGLKFDPDRVEADFGPDLGRRMVELFWNAPKMLFDMADGLGIACEAQRTGTIRAALHAKFITAVEASVEQAARRGMPVEYLNAQQIAVATGTSRYAGGMLDHRGGHINPLSLARGLAKAAIRAGAAIHGRTPATKIWRDGGRWRVQTPTGQVSADKLVLATNGYTDGLWPGLKRTIVPVFSGIVASEPLPSDLVQTVFPARASLYELGLVTLYYRLDASNRLLIGGRCRQGRLEGPDELGFLIQYARKLWPQLRPFAFTHGWNGQVAVTADHYPHLHEPAPGLTACLGYNGRGVAAATALGPQIARRVLEGDGAVIDLPVTDLKTFPFHPFWKIGVSAGIAYGRARDYWGF